MGVLSTIKIFLFVVVLAILAGGVWYVMKLQKDNATLVANEVKLTTAIAEQQEVIEQQKKDYETIVEANNELNNAIAEANKAKDELQKKLSKHDINYLAVEKPGLIERIINKGTADVLGDFETITSE